MWLWTVLCGSGVLHEATEVAIHSVKVTSHLLGETIRRRSLDRAFYQRPLGPDMDGAALLAALAGPGSVVGAPVAAAKRQGGAPGGVDEASSAAEWVHFNGVLHSFPLRGSEVRPPFVGVALPLCWPLLPVPFYPFIGERGSLLQR